MNLNPKNNLSPIYGPINDEQLMKKIEEAFSQSSLLKLTFITSFDDIIFYGMELYCEDEKEIEIDKDYTWVLL